MLQIHQTNPISVEPTPATSRNGQPLFPTNYHIRVDWAQKSPIFHKKFGASFWKLLYSKVLKILKSTWN